MPRGVDTGDDPRRRPVNPNQLPLFVNPTEHIARMQHSTDSGSLTSYSGSEVSYGDSEESDPEYYGRQAGSNPAPNPTMEAVWKWKEGESLEPADSGVHGNGLFDLLDRGEQLRKPIDVQLGSKPAYDVQYEGHHRVAAAHAVQRDTGRQVFVPVEHQRTGEYNAEQRVAEYRERDQNESFQNALAARDPDYARKLSARKAARMQRPSVL